MASYLLFLVLLILLFRDFKKYFIIYISISVFLSICTLRFASIFELLSACSVPIFFYKVNFDTQYIRKFPVKESFILIALSYLISNFFGVYRHTPSTLLTIVILVWNIFCFWYILERNPRKYISIFIKSTLFFGGCLGFYAIFETITSSNPLVKLFYNIGLYANDNIITSIRFGVKRCQSFLLMHTTAGGLSFTLCCFLLYCKQKGYVLLNKNISIFVLISLSLSVFFSGSRCAIAGFCAAFAMFATRKNLKIIYIILTVVVIAVFSLAFNEYIMAVYKSFADTESVGGSNSDMRNVQFTIALNAMDKSPWIGNGIAYTWEHVLKNNPNLLGAESLWIPIMIDNGILGIAAYVFFFVQSILLCIKQKEYLLSFFVIGIILLFSLSSVPNYSVTYSFTYLYVMIKYKEIKKRHQQNMKKKKLETELESMH